jgi:hypothetical protein
MLFKTFEALCEKRGYDPVKILPDVSGMLERLRAPFIAEAKLTMLIDEVNEGKEANWEDTNEPKYMLLWDMEESASGSGFRLEYVDDGYRISTVSSRLTFRNTKGGKFSAKHHFDLWKIYMKGK